MPTGVRGSTKSGRLQIALLQSRMAQIRLASEGLRQEIAAEAKSDAIHGVRHTVGDVRRDVDAETLQFGDALLAGASQQAIARELFGDAIAPSRWRVKSASYRLRVQRLVKAARRYLAEPLGGPWFD